MSNNQTLELIESLIQKTKNSTITWNKYSNTNYEIKPLPKSSLDNNHALSDVSLADTAEYTTFEPTNSYVSAFGDGIFLLLFYSSILFGNRLDLRVQTKNSQTSKIFASTESKNVEISSQLKRLYNIADSANSTLDIDTFVDNFVKSE